MTHFWGIIVLILPVWLKVGKMADMRISKDQFLMAMITFSLIVFGINKENLARHKLTVGAMVTILLMAFLNQHDHQSLNVWMHFTGLSLVFCLISQFLGNKNSINYQVIFNYMAIACLIQSTWMIFNSLGIDLYEIFLMSLNPKYKKFINNGDIIHEAQGVITIVTGSLGNSALSSAFVASTFPVFLRKKWFYLIPIPLTGLYFGSSSVAWGTVLIVFLFFLIKKFNIKYRYIFIFSLICTSIGYFLIPDIDLGTGNGRFPIWKQALVWYQDYFSIISGRGPGYWPDWFNYFHPAKVRFMQAHNEYIEAYIAFGITGLVLFSILIINALKSKCDILAKCLFLSCLLISSCHFFFHVSSTVLIGVIAFCACLNKDKDNSDNFSTEGKNGTSDRPKKSFKSWKPKNVPNKGHFHWRNCWPFQPRMGQH